MRIALDMQGVQLEFAAGIKNGPLLALSVALLRERGEHSVVLAMRAGIEDTVEQVKGALHPLLAPGILKVWHASGLLDQPEAADGWIGAASACILDAFITRMEPDLVVIPISPHAVSSHGLVRFGNTRKVYRTAVVMAGSPADIGRSLSRQNSHAAGLHEQLLTADLLGTVAPLSVCEVLEFLRLDRHQNCHITERIDSENPEILAARLLSFIQKEARLKSIEQTSADKKRLAYVSPLPPLRSGISDYSADLLPELAKFYDIELIVDQKEVSTPWILDNFKIRSIEWFRDNFYHFDRALYHLGNSSYHQHMFDLYAQIPGVLVLHDFYLGDVINFIESHNISNFFYLSSLYRSHGYKALLERFMKDGLPATIRKYPSNLEALVAARGVIVHSQFSRNLANHWYGEGFSRDWSVIPLLRKSTQDINRDRARKSLGFKSDDFLVCSFGLLGPGKLNHLLLSSWLDSEMSKDSNCYLLFVGENHDGEYGAQLENSIKANFCENRIRITGWADEAAFRAYLAAADVAVQLRSQSRGETSAAVFDCMSHALPTIVNAHGSFVELPEDAVLMLPDEFTTNELRQSLEVLWQDASLRLAIGEKAQVFVQDHQNPATCARQYANAIEQAYASSDCSVSGLIRQIARLEAPAPTNSELETLANAIAKSMPEEKAARQLMVDVSATCRNDLKTGIQRVVRALVWELVHAPPAGYRIEPVYLTDEGGCWHYRYARKWTSALLGIQSGWMPDDSVEVAADDVLLVADFTSHFAVEAERSGLLCRLKEIGVSIHFVVYDLLPILKTEFFPVGQFGFYDWINTVIRVADSTLCISRSVAEDLKTWISGHPQPRIFPMGIDWFHLGADIDQSAPTNGLPKDAQNLLALVNSSPSFLMVGTIEPRKGYIQVVDAFTELWQDGVQINLVIVGKEGWLGLPDSQRRTIPAIVERLRCHPEFGKRLLWMDGISDEFLLNLYASCTCLIAASEGEGFGLPLIEAAQHKIPIIARNIPVFQEVAGPYAYYFDGMAPQNLVDAIRSWLDMHNLGVAPSSSDMPWLTWKQSTQEVLKKLGVVTA